AGAILLPPTQSQQGAFEHIGKAPVLPQPEHPHEPWPPLRGYPYLQCGTAHLPVAIFRCRSIRFRVAAAQNTEYIMSLVAMSSGFAMLRPSIHVIIVNWNS